LITNKLFPAPRESPTLPCHNWGQDDLPTQNSIEQPQRRKVPQPHLARGQTSLRAPLRSSLIGGEGRRFRKSRISRTNPIFQPTPAATNRTFHGSWPNFPTSRKIGFVWVRYRPKIGFPNETPKKQLFTNDPHKSLKTEDRAKTPALSGAYPALPHAVPRQGHRNSPLNQFDKVLIPVL
jgi:hypothetical protein